MTQKWRIQQLTKIYRNLNTGKLYCYCLAILPIGCILKPPPCVSRLPRPEVHLLKVKAGARMDKEDCRKASQGGEDALAHSSILPCHHKILLRGGLFNLFCFSEREQKTQLVAYFTNGFVFPITRIIQSSLHKNGSLSRHMSLTF